MTILLFITLLHSIFNPLHSECSLNQEGVPLKICCRLTADKKACACYDNNDSCRSCGGRPIAIPSMSDL